MVKSHPLTRRSLLIAQTTTRLHRGGENVGEGCARGGWSEEICLILRHRFIHFILTVRCEQGKTHLVKRYAATGLQSLL